MTRFRISISTRGALLLVLLGIGFIFLWTIRPILPPLIWALIVAYILSPAIRSIERRSGMPRLLIVFLLFGILVTFLAWAAIAVRPIVMAEFRDLLRTIPRIVAGTQEYFLGSGPIDVLGIVIDPSGIKDEMNAAVQDSVASLGRRAIPFVMRAVSSIVDTVLFLISVFYLLLDLDKVGPALVNFLPRRWRREIIPLLMDMERVLGNYIRGQMLLIIIMSVVSWIVLTVLQVRFSLLLALVTGVVEIFPVIGPWTAGGIAVSVALTQSTSLFGGSSAALAAVIAASYFILRQAEDILIIPNVVGKIMELHPLVVLFALLSGGYLAGILGVLIAVPVAAVIKLWLRFMRDKLGEEERAGAAPRRAANGESLADEDVFEDE